MFSISEDGTWCILISISIGRYLSHLSCLSIGPDLQVLLHDDSKFLMLQVASGCYDPLGADDRAGGIALPSVFAQAGKRHGGKRRRWASDANDGSRPWDMDGDSDHRIAFGHLSGRVEVGESGRSKQARKCRLLHPRESRHSRMERSVSCSTHPCKISHVCALFGVSNHISTF